MRLVLPFNAVDSGSGRQSGIILGYLIQFLTLHSIHVFTLRSVEGQTRYSSLLQLASRLWILIPAFFSSSLTSTLRYTYMVVFFSLTTTYQSTFVASHELFS